MPANAAKGSIGTMAVRGGTAIVVMVRLAAGIAATNTVIGPSSTARISTAGTMSSSMSSGITTTTGPGVGDVAIWMAGHVSVPIYPNLTADSMRTILEHSESQLIFVGKLDDLKDYPEFYMRTSVVDVMFGANSDGLITSADGQATNRIRWEITEKSLIARLTYEQVQDSDHKGSRTTNDGQIVAAFAIEKHFDIKRDYNTTTGEEMNVVVENDVDRPWHQRAYFRVDWSRNLVTDAYTLDTLAQIGILYAVEWESLA